MRNVLIWALLLCMMSFKAQAQGRKRNIPVHVTVGISRQSNDPNLILYSRERLLSVGDFRGRPDMASHGVGATYSGILMETEGMERQGVLEIRVTLTIYFDKARSWMKKEGRTQRVLDHEQAHFDLTAIKACALAKAIAAEHYTAGNVQDRIRELQRAHTAGLSRLQQDYDRETRHGTLPEEQAAWAERIARELAASACI